MYPILRRNILFFLVLISGSLALFLNLGGLPLSQEEGIFAEVTREMLLSSDFFHPTLNGKEVSPITLFPAWLASAFSILRGKLDEQTLRLSSAFLGILTLVLFYSVTKQILDKRSALFSTALFLATYDFLQSARSFSMDIYLLFISLFFVYFLLKFFTKSPFLRNLFVFIFLFSLSFMPYFSNYSGNSFLLSYLLPWNLVLPFAFWYIINNWSQIDKEIRSLTVLVLGLSIFGIWHNSLLKLAWPMFLILISFFLQQNLSRKSQGFLVFYNFLLAILGILSFSLAILPHNLVFYPYESLFRYSVGILGIFLFILSLFSFKDPLLSFIKVIISFSLIWIVFFSLLKPLFLQNEEKIWADIAKELRKEKAVEKICFFKEPSFVLLYYLNPPRTLPVIKTPSEVSSCRNQCLIFVPSSYLSEVLPFAKGAKFINLPETLLKNPKYLLLLFP